MSCLSSTGDDNELFKNAMTISKKKKLFVRNTVKQNKTL